MSNNYLNQDLTGTNFDGQDLSYVLFRGANLTDCSFVGCDLSGANMREAIVEGADFTGATMYHSNIKDAAGTADFTDALVFGMPQWIPMPGSICVDPEIQERQIQIDALILHSEIIWDNYTLIDRNTMTNYIQHSYSEQELSGDYDNMSPGKGIYTSIGSNDYGNLSCQWIISEHMKQGTTFDTDQDKFIANPEYVEEVA